MIKSKTAVKKPNQGWDTEQKTKTFDNQRCILMQIYFNISIQTLYIFKTHFIHFLI